MRKFDIVVIGAGISGLSVAKKAAKLGFSVCLIEKSKVGGKFLWSETFPSAFFSEAAKKFEEIKSNRSIGLNSKLDFDFDFFLKKMNKSVVKVYEKNSPDELSRLGIKVVFGFPKFINKNVVELNNENIYAKKFVLATGSKNYIPNIEGLDSVKFLDFKSFFSLKKLPKSICIVGGGIKGVELSFALSVFGCQVALLEQNSRILYGFDRDVSDFVNELLEKKGVKIFNDVLIKKVSHASGKNIVEAVTDKKKVLVKSDHVFFAMGDLACVEGLNLPAAGIRFDEGGIKINKRCRTNVKKIFACGSVAGSRDVSCSIHQADILLSNILHIPKYFNFENVVQKISIDPEIAVLGKVEKDFSSKVVDSVKVYFKDIDACSYKCCNSGFLKVILKKSKIVGVVLVCREASVLINNYLFALGKNFSVLRKLSFPVPSLAEINSFILEKFEKKSRLKNFFIKVSGRF
jgi:pyruvate/2-oxoglutarate dehydrogenase complex dihydrolipoamide dehydrogenase (E3) component